MKRRLMPALFPLDYPRVNVPRPVVERLIRENGANDWHLFGFDYARRIEAPLAMRWIARNVPKSASIFETGCGVGVNLLFLSQFGFRQLGGSDIEPAAIAAGRAIASYAGATVKLRVDDSLRPAEAPKADVLIALAWIYLSGVGFQLGSFLERYRTGLSDGAYVVFDMVDASFNELPNNDKRTDDWELPAERQRPTQYRLRMSEAEVRRVADAAGFDIADILPGSAIPPRRVYILKRRTRSS